jgi:hypothetical protein
VDSVQVYPADFLLYIGRLLRSFQIIPNFLNKSKRAKKELTDLNKWTINISKRGTDNKSKPPKHLVLVLAGQFRGNFTERRCATELFFIHHLSKNSFISYNFKCKGTESLPFAWIHEPRLTVPTLGRGHNPVKLLPT